MSGPRKTAIVTVFWFSVIWKNAAFELAGQE